MRRNRGLSIRGIQGIMAIVILIIAVLLLFATFRTKYGYSQMREYTESYLRWEQDADNLQLASDYLTEQVRCFVETGKREYLDNYFEEAHVTRRREKALESIESIAGNSPAYQSLEAAMNESVALMNKEYYAMRLAVAAFFSRFFVFPSVLLWKQPLPAEVFCRIRGAFFNIWRKQDFSPSVSEVFFVNLFYFCDMFFQFWNKAFGKHYPPVFSTFAVSDCDFGSLKVNIKNSKAQKFVQSHPSSVKKFNGKLFVFFKMCDFSRS